MNVSANYLIGSGLLHPRVGGWTFSQQILLLAFCFAKVFGLWLILPISPLWGLVESLQRRV